MAFLEVAAHVSIYKLAEMIPLDDGSPTLARVGVQINVYILNGVLRG